MSIDDGIRGICLASAKLPIYGGRNMKIFVFGRGPEDAEVAALVHKTPAATDEATVRLHSICLTGDVFGSAKCDCGAQLRLAIDAISRADFGIVLYLMRHEGRGIGLVNKVRAYALQDEGLDTVEANRALGFAPDARDFSIAADALRELGVAKIRLLTNNPTKVAAMERSGIRVIERITLDAPMTEHNRDYLDTKRRFFGHMPSRDPTTEYLAPHAFAELFDRRNTHGNGAPGQNGASVLAIMIESYWEVHDKLGNDAANAMLRAVTRQLKTAVRADEILARSAEDRLLLVLDGVPASIAERIAARLRETFRGMMFEWRDREYPVRISVGVSQLMPGEDPATMLQGTERTVPDDVAHPASR